MSKSEDHFKEELELIKSRKIRDFVIDVHENLASSYFWTAPASSTGKYHPKWDNGENGLVRHVKVVSTYGYEFARSIPLTVKECSSKDISRQVYSDTIVAACLLHDCENFGPNYDGTRKSLPKDNGKMHGIRMAKKIYEAKFKGKKVPFPYKCILRGIACHMGIWTGFENIEYIPTYQKDPVLKKVCECVHFADYAASRRMPPHILKLMKEFG
jgi:hypothetical protein